jgi:hypothetical protein
MDAALKVLEAGVGACITFGPLFMIMVARDDNDHRTRLTRGMNYAGLTMLVAGLIWINITLIVQRGKVEILEQRVGYLEERLSAPPKGKP